MNFTPGSGKWRPFGDAASLPQKAVANLFDDYATTFDESLDSLGYRVPGLIASKLRMLRPIDCVGRSKGSRGWIVADVGCGTGKVGTALRAQNVPLAAPLLGCDLSPRILKECRCRTGQLYGTLACKDASVFLTELASTTASVRRARKTKGRCSEEKLITVADSRRGCKTLPCDRRKRNTATIGSSKNTSPNARATTLQAPIRAEGSASIDATRCPKWITAIIAADVLVYIGECTAFFKAAAKCLPKGGILIFSVESLEKAIVAYDVEAKNSVAASMLSPGKSASNDGGGGDVVDGGGGGGDVVDGDDDESATLCSSGSANRGDAQYHDDADGGDVRHLLLQGYRLLPSDRFAYVKENHQQTVLAARCNFVSHHKNDGACCFPVTKVVICCIGRRYTEEYIRNISQATGFETLEGMRKVEGRVYIMRWQGTQISCRHQEILPQCSTEELKK